MYGDIYMYFGVAYCSTSSVQQYLLPVRNKVKCSTYNGRAHQGTNAKERSCNKRKKHTHKKKGQRHGIIMSSLSSPSRLFSPQPAICKLQVQHRIHSHISHIYFRIHGARANAKKRERGKIGRKDKRIYHLIYILATALCGAAKRSQRFMPQPHPTHPHLPTCM